MAPAEHPFNFSRKDTKASSITVTPSELESNGSVNSRTWGLGLWSLGDPPKEHTVRIILACCLVVLPMVAFSIALLYIVFTNLVDRTPCPFPELCPGNDLLNTTSSWDYYVDFSATRIAFLASLSSSISFSLVSILMSMYAYWTAREILQSSMGPQAGGSLPSPYQMAMLIRVLNAELLAIWEMFWRKVEEIFWRRERSQEKKDRMDFPSMVRASVIFFLFSLLASIYIQAADSYLHISAEAVNMIEVQVESAQSNQHSRGLSQWCIDRQGTGTIGNKNFWSCSLSYEFIPDIGGSMSLSNGTGIAAVDNSVSPHEEIYTHEHEDGDTYAIVAPAKMDPSIDWKGTTFGVSTQCSTIPAAACDTSDLVQTGATFYVPFSCNRNRSGIDFAGNVTQSITQHNYLDFHKYFKEISPFNGQSFDGWDEIEAQVPNITEKETDEIFRNPWHWMHVHKYADDVPHSSKEYLDDPSIWKLMGMQDFHMLKCNSTVWDITYSVVGGNITSISKTKSNGSIAGIASMASIQAFNPMAGSWTKAYNTANFLQNSPQSFVQLFKAAASRTLALPLAAQSAPRPSELVQRRISKVVTRLPKASLWILVSANLIFALLGIGLAIAALRSNSADAYQVQTRLGVAGLAAALFETQHSERLAREDSKLFEENAGKTGGVRKKVGMKLTHAGGAGFVLNRVRG